MPATVAILYALIGMMLVGVIVFFTGVVQVITARRREVGMRAPLIASGVGFVIVLVAVISIGITGAMHTETFVTYSTLR